jgi:pimeloyl-ACP methyl ester carboxylesterase
VQFRPLTRRDPAFGRATNILALLIEGELDLVTPPWAEDQFHRHFTNGRQVVFPHMGHVAIGLDGLECVDNVEEQFLSTMDPRRLDTGCRDNIRRKAFLVEDKN